MPSIVVKKALEVLKDILFGDQSVVENYCLIEEALDDNIGTFDPRHRTY
jgi:hypothetical protein